MISHVPNLVALLAHSEHALGNYLNFQNGRSTLNAREKEVINLVVSQYNHCAYCLAAHTAIAKMNGFTDEEIISIRKTRISFNSKLDALDRLVKSIIENKGHAEETLLDNFYNEGYIMPL